MTYRNELFGLLESDVVGFTEEQRLAVELQLCVSVADLSAWTYDNLRHPRYEYHYGYAQIMSGAFVVADIPLSYINQEILHWRNEDFGINETTGCYAKGLAQLINNGVIVPNTVPTRVRYTSVRFRFFPGVKANCVIKYEVGQPKCGGNIIPPDNAQGNPPDPANHSHDPSARPPDQPADNTDRSPNDGEPPNPGEEPPPTTGIYPEGGQWFVVYAGQDATQNCHEFSGSEPLAGATDPNYRPVYTKTQDDPCPGTFRGQILYKGNAVKSFANASLIAFEFRAPSN